jgi:hypothetical protein
MQYVNKTFTLPSTNKRMTQEEYEVAVGLRCAVCGRLIRPGISHKQCLPK